MFVGLKCWMWMVIIIYITVLLKCQDVTDCNTMLVQNLKDDQFVSTPWYGEVYAPRLARLSTESLYTLKGAWSPSYITGNEFIQVKFYRMKSLTAIGTKGRDDRWNFWVTKYRVLYSLDGIDWTVVKDIGGSDMV